jgi:DNA-directed RNA polymerase subunit RPC12/RpoP
MMSRMPAPSQPDNPTPSIPGADIQFERAELLTPDASPRICAACHATIRNSYYTSGGRLICTNCAHRILATKPPEPGAQGLLRAALFGAGAALLGTIVYFAVLALSGYEIGFIAVGVGWLVGKAVHKGGYGRGGWKLQALAVGLTYCSIVGSYVPLAIKTIVAKQGQSVAAAAEGPALQSPTSSGAAGVGLGLGLLILFGYSLAAPFLGGFRNILGLFIIGLGLYEAWRLNRRPQLVLSGPHTLKAAG